MNNRTGPETRAAGRAAKNSQTERRALRANAPLVVLGALLAGTLLTRCSASKDPSADGGAGSGGAGGASGGADASGECTPATVPVDCPLPPSICDDIRTLRYYTDASCVAGRCQWTRATVTCTGGSCMNGACLGSGTTTTGGPPPPGTGTAGAGGGRGGTGGAGTADARTLLNFANPRCV